MYTDEDFEINSILPRILRLILTGKNSYRRDRKGYSQRIFVSGAYPVYPKVVHNVKTPLTCSDFTMHMQISFKQAHL